MATIISYDFKQKNNLIDIAKINQKRTVNNELLLPAKEDIQIETVQEHTSEPIKDINDINRISQYLINNERYRDNMLFIVGINFGLRVSDLVQLRFCQLINNDYSFKTSFPILEKKTKNTRKVQKNRYITINEAVMDAVTLYLQNNPSHLDDYMFRSESNRGSNTNKPLDRASVDRILKGIAKDLNLNSKIATHSLRKTFAYHQMVMSGNDPRKLLLLQKMFGHSSAAQTLDYIGITNEEIQEAYLNLNLGNTSNYLVKNTLYEKPCIVS